MKHYLLIITSGIILTLIYIAFSQTNYRLGLNDKISHENQSNEKYVIAEIGDIYGIDVSHHQGKIEWEKVRQWNGNKIHFVYIKATEGSTFTDKAYRRNLKGARENNLLVGSYHYFRTTSSVKTQFENFINSVDKDKQDLIPLIDVEEKRNWGDSEFHNNLQEFLNLVENHFGAKPMIYTVNSFYNINLSGKYKSYHSHIGRYGANPPNMRDKTTWTIWQFTETGKVDGIPKHVDINVINRKYSLQDLLLKK